MAGNRPTALPAPMSELDTPLRAGIGPSGSGASGDALADGLAAAGATAVTATVSPAAGGVHVAEVTTLATAVSVTELTVLAPDATGIWACRLTGCLSDTELTVQLAVLSPLAQPPENVGFWLVGLAESVTYASETGPFLVETCTTNAASCPRLMLACPRWTLTHSFGAVAAALALVLGLELALELGSALGLVARRASSDAGAVAWADDEVAAVDGAADDDEVADDDGAADDEVAEPDGEGDPETEDDPDGDGSAVPVALGSTLEEALGSADEPEIDADADADADGDADTDGEGDGDGDGDGDGEGDGEGDGVLEDGSSWQVVCVLAEPVVVPALGEAVVLAEGVAVASPTEPASAMPDQAASMLTTRKPPASKLSVVARTCAKRILDCPVWTARHGCGAFFMCSESTRRWIGTEYSYPVAGSVMHVREAGSFRKYRTPDVAGPSWRG